MHLSFQEYFTAQYLFENTYRDSLTPLFENHWYEDRWREVFLRTAEIFPNADYFFEMFIEALDKYAMDNPRLLKLLKFANSFGDNKLNASPPILKNRTGIIFVIVDITDSLARAFNRTRTLAFTLVSAFDLTLTFERDRTIDITLALDHARDNYYALALALDQTLIFALTRTLGQHYNKAMIICNELELTELSNELSVLKVPVEESPIYKWRKFDDALWAIFRKHRPVEQYEFTVEEAEVVANYLDGVKLLLDCLEVAYVSDRDGIKEQLLRVPPGA